MSSKSYNTMNTINKTIDSKTNLTDTQLSEQNVDCVEESSSKICEELNVDPRSVGFCIGKHRVNLRRVGNEVYQKTGTTVYIKYITPPGYEWGFFKIISRSKEGIEIAKKEIKKMEFDFLELIREGKMTPLRKKHIHEIKAWSPDYRNNNINYKNFNKENSGYVKPFSRDEDKYDMRSKFDEESLTNDTKHEEFCWTGDHFEGC